MRLIFQKVHAILATPAAFWWLFACFGLLHVPTVYCAVENSGSAVLVLTIALMAAFLLFIYNLCFLKAHKLQRVFGASMLLVTPPWLFGRSQNFLVMWTRNRPGVGPRKKASVMLLLAKAPGKLHPCNDLSGTFQGAGGIGGLLARSEPSTLNPQHSTALYHADGNGNITALVTTSATIAAKYHYDPYSNLLKVEGWGSQPATKVARYHTSLPGCTTGTAAADAEPEGDNANASNFSFMKLPRLSFLLVACLIFLTACIPTVADKNTRYSRNSLQEAFSTIVSGDSLATVDSKVGPPLFALFSGAVVEEPYWGWSERVYEYDEERIVAASTNRKLRVFLVYSEPKNPNRNYMLYRVEMKDGKVHEAYGSMEMD
jgi:hypothetical protein